MFDLDACYAALTARDARFDGMFFVGVATTGIYCRPVCVARTPRRDRCSFHRSAAEAERSGFRACFRCRPDALPRLVAGAAALIDDGPRRGLATVASLRRHAPVDRARRAQPMTTKDPMPTHIGRPRRLAGCMITQARELPRRRQQLGGQAIAVGPERRGPERARRRRRREADLGGRRLLP